MSVVDDIKQRLDIVAGVSRYVPLQKAGRNFRAPCPFHQERTPSFYVFPEGQSWHCFGACGTGGDIFSFVMKKENIPFGEALRLLAEQAGVTLPERSDGTPQDGAARARLLEALTEASRFYYRTLTETPEGAAARDYLAGRGLTPGTIHAFQLGFSPEGWGALHRTLRGRGFSDEELIEAGLIIPGESGTLRQGSGQAHDRFRGRVMFPLRDARGRVVGFGARAMDGAPPKYLNSPQTSVFDKGALLYGLDAARESIRRDGQAVIVEGYVDAIMAHQAGFSNVIASMGTALTERQVGLLRGVARQIVLALDADTAGAEATLRGVTVLSDALDRKVVPVPVAADSQRGLRVLIRYEQTIDTEIRVAVLPAGKDPDDVIRQDPNAWRDLIVGSLPVLDYVMGVATSGIDLSQSRVVSVAAERVLPFIVEVRDPVRQSHALQKLARLLQIDERALQARLRAVPPTDERRERSRGRSAPAPANTTPIPDAVPGRPAEGLDQVEEMCLALLLQDPECAANVAALNEDDFLLPERRSIISAWNASGGFPQFWDELDPALHEYVSQVMAFPLPPGATPDRATALQQCTRRLEARRLRRAKMQQARLLQEPAAAQEAISLMSLALWRRSGESGAAGMEVEGSAASPGGAAERRGPMASPVSEGDSPELAQQREAEFAEVLSIAQAQQQGLQINERLRALFYETEPKPSGKEK